MSDSFASSNPFALEKFRRVAILGIGNELNGDDAAGVLAARQLNKMIKGSAQPGAPSAALLVIEAGAAPENFTGPLRRFHPDLVLLVDAADFDELPGSLAWIDWQDADGMSASSHTLPPSLLVKYLMGELGCRFGMVGIQPQHLEFTEPLSPPVARAVQRLCEELFQWLMSE